MYEIVDCKFGQIVLEPTSEMHICASSTTPDNRKLPFIIRRTKYRVSVAHLYRYKDGTWHIGEETRPEFRRAFDGLFMSRDDFTGRGPSAAARQSALEEIERVVNAWAAKNVEALSFAQHAALEHQLDRLLMQRKELMRQVESVDAEIEVVRSKLDSE